MNVDFALVLVIGSIVSGLIWLVDAKFYAKNRQIVEGEEQAEPILVEYARFLFPVFLAVLLLRGFLVEPFRIPSGSMLPTLEVGDFILVSKFSYGLRAPVINEKFVDLGHPERGDVIVFRYPENPSIDYIKRVIGVPGDEIAYYNKHVYINGKPVNLSDDGKYTVDYSEFTKKVEKFDNVSHKILVNDGIPATDFVVTVPADSYFVLGDNRDNSRDSRYWGFVPEENLVGKAFLVWMSWRWGEWPQLSRIGTVIK